MADDGAVDVGEARLEASGGHSDVGLSDMWPPDRVTRTRRATPARVQQRADQFARALSVGGLESWSWEPATRTVTTTPGFEAMLGLPAGSMQDRPDRPSWFWTHAHPDDRERVRSAFRHTWQTGESFAVEYRVENADGALRWLQSAGGATVDTAGQVVGLDGVVTDITERKRAAAAAELRLAVGEACSSTLDRRAIALEIARLLLPTLGEWCIISLRDETGELVRVASRHVDPNAAPLVDQLLALPRSPHMRRVLAGALERSSPTLIERFDAPALGYTPADPQWPLLDELQIATGLIVPLGARGAIQGLIQFVSSRPGAFGAIERELAGELAHTIALGLDNARLLAAERAAREEAEANARRVALLQAQAEASRDRLQRIIDALPEAVVVADAQGQVMVFNTTARQIFGDAFGRATLLRDGATPAGYGIRALDGRPIATHDLPLQRAVYGRETVIGQQLMLRHAGAGRDITVIANAAPITAADGAPAGGIVVVQDISPLKEIEQVRDELIANVSHDLKSPLTVVLGLSQLVAWQLGEIDHPDVEGMRANLGGVYDAVNRMTRMLDELLDVARLQLGQALTIDPRPTDVLQVVRAAVSAHDSSNPNHTVNVVTELPALVAVLDRDRFDRVLNNLLGNAVKYSPAGGVVRVSVQRDRVAGEVVIAVTDAGIGIPAADLPRVFERYHRAENVGRIAGTGIGLSGSRRIVEAHGGSLTVESREGVGSTFTVRLPLGSDRIVG